MSGKYLREKRQKINKWNMYVKKIFMGKKDKR